MSQLAHVTTPTWAWTPLLLPPWSKQFKCKDVSQAKPQFQNKRMEKKIEKSNNLGKAEVNCSFHVWACLGSFLFVLLLLIPF